MASSSASNMDPPPAVDERAEAALFEDITSWVPPPPYTAEMSAVSLPKPVVIPRIDTVGQLSEKLPFIRAYSPDLRDYDLNEADFVKFIDSLAVCQTAPVPLKMLDAASTVIGFFPDVWAQAASAGIGIAAGAGTVATILVRTRLFMEKMNREFFAPRGLKVSIYKTETLAEKLGCGILAPTSTSTSSVEEHPGYLRDRQMQMLAPFIAPLSFDVPPPSKQRLIIDEMSAKQIRRRIEKREKRQMKQAEKRNRKEAKRLVKENGSGHVSSSSSSSSSSSTSSLRIIESNEADRIDQKKARKMQEIEKEADKRIASAQAKNADMSRSKIEAERDRKLQKVEAEFELRAEKREKKLEHKTERREKKLERKAEKSNAKAARKHVKALAKTEKMTERRVSKEEKTVGRMEFLVVEELQQI